MAERIYTRDQQGRLEPLDEERFSTEDELQALIAEHPELLDGEQMRPGDPLRWILITREQGIAETSGAGTRWSLDHLIIDQDATPTLVEVKRGSNPEIRRTIVGQMLEYAAHASQTWTADEIRRTFEQKAHAQGVDPDEELGKLLKVDEDPNADDFWQTVATNLAAKRLRLLFVADEIPDTLQRVVEFLNEQMPNIEVLAVEIKQFRGESTQTLVPRVLGRIAASTRRSTAGPRNRIDRETFLEDFTIPEQRDAATKLIDAAEKAGAVFNWDSAGVSVRGCCSRWRQPISLAWLWSPSRKGFSDRFTFGVETRHYETADEALGTILKSWIDQFSSDNFAQESQRKDMKAYVVGYDDAVRNIDLLAERLTETLVDLQSL